MTAVTWVAFLAGLLAGAFMYLLTASLLRDLRSMNRWAAFQNVLADYFDALMMYGLARWDPQVDYFPSALVLTGSDRIHCAQVATGPGWNNPTDPTTPGQQVWLEMPF